MAWRRSGDKPLSESMRVSLPTHICVTRPQWVKKRPVPYNILTQLCLRNGLSTDRGQALHDIKMIHYLLDRQEQTLLTQNMNISSHEIYLLMLSSIKWRPLSSWPNKLNDFRNKWVPSMHYGRAHMGLINWWRQGTKTPRYQWRHAGPYV